MVGGLVPPYTLRTGYLRLQMNGTACNIRASAALAIGASENREFSKS